MRGPVRFGGALQWVAIITKSGPGETTVLERADQKLRYFLLFVRQMTKTMEECVIAVAAM